MNDTQHQASRADATEQQPLQLDLIPLADVPRILPPRRGGKRIHPSCVFRWASEGVLGCKLRWISMGRCRVTRREWLEEFFAQVAAARDPAAAPESEGARRRPPARRAAQGQDRKARTAEVLRRHGLGGHGGQP